MKENKVILLSRISWINLCLFLLFILIITNTIWNPKKNNRHSKILRILDKAADTKLNFMNHCWNKTIISFGNLAKKVKLIAQSEWGFTNNKIYQALIFIYLFEKPSCKVRNRSSKRKQNETTIKYFAKYKTRKYTREARIKKKRLKSERVQFT